MNINSGFGLKEKFFYNYINNIELRCMYRVFRYIILSGVLFSISCTYNLFIPPANVSNLESPSINKAGEKSLSTGGGISGPLIRDNTINDRYRFINGYALGKFNLSDFFELTIRLNGLYMHNIKPLKEYLLFSPNLYLGGKLSFGNRFMSRILAFSFGAGLGYSDIGNYCSINCTEIIGFENRYIIPFYNITQYIGIPINPEPHDISGEGDYPGDYVKTLQTTYGLILTAGFKAPLESYYSLKRKFRLSVSYSWAVMDNGDFGTFYHNVSSGVDVEL